jgi:hypothetical protein
VTPPSNAAFTADADDPLPGLDGDSRDPDATPPGDPRPDAELEPGDPAEPVGNDNIRDGRVGGVMGGPRQQQGQGEGG